MKVEEFLIKEINKVFEKELFNRFDEEKALTLYNKVNKIIVEDVILEDVLALFKSDNDLATLSKTIKYFELLRIENHSSKRDFLFIEEKITQNTSDKILITIWAIAKRKSFDTDEFLDIELIEYYNKIFTKYSFLLNFDDFIEITDFFYILFNNEDFIKELIPVLENAVNKHTNNLVVIATLVNVYYKFGFVSKAEKLIDKTVLELEGTNLEFHKIDELGLNSKERIYLSLKEIRALINYKLGYFDKALKDTAFVIDKVISVYKEESPFPTFNEVSILIQLSIFLKEKKTTKFNESIEYIKKYWTVLILEEWATEFPEIVNYLKSINFGELDN